MREEGKRSSKEEEQKTSGEGGEGLNYFYFAQKKGRRILRLWYHHYRTIRYGHAGTGYQIISSCSLPLLACRFLLDIVDRGKNAACQ